MKLDKLYTEAGFGFYLKSLTTSEFCKLSGSKIPTYKNGCSPKENAHDFIVIDAIMLRMRNDYDKIMLGSLTKEMFVNPYEKPKEFDFIVGSSIDSMFDVALELWQEAEKKVIFEDVVLCSDAVVDFYIGKYEFIKNEDGVICVYDVFTSDCVEIKTIHDLAEYTKGELTTKNLNI
jgi:hypothetical protein